MTKFETNALATERRAAGEGRASFRHSNFVIRHSFVIRISSFEFPRRTRRGFTLIELMISIALVLVLMLGINQIFKYTTQAVGAGEAINAATRGSRAIQAAFAQDFAAMVAPGGGPTDAPYLIISNGQIYAYRNPKDLAAQGATSGSAPTFSPINGSNVPIGSPYQDLAGTGNFGDPNVNGDVTYPYTYNNRNHRIDVLSFFARDQFHRQTGNAGTFVDDMSSPEAMIWYGHANIPDNTGTYLCGPGQPLASGFNNDNNYFANQFVLARMAMLLVDKTPDSGGGTIFDNSGNSQYFINRTQPYPWTSGSAATDLEPLWYNSHSYDGAYIYQSRYDLAATTISSFRAKMQSYLANGGNTSPWWQYLMDGEPVVGAPRPTSYRYACSPYITKPMTASGMAAAAPYFLGSCTQFTVEFAGDYITQENNPNGATITTSNGPVSYSYGQFISAGADGEVDYRIVKDAVTNILRKQIIWYGLPRNTSGIPWTASSGPGSPSGDGDVMPAGWWIGAVQRFEKSLPGVYSAVAGSAYTQSPTNMQPGDRYICAWGPNDNATRPKLIRITVTLDDPNGQLPDGQTYQYVFAVP